MVRSSGAAAYQRRWDLRSKESCRGDPPLRLVLPFTVTRMVLQGSLQKEAGARLSRRLVAEGYTLAAAYLPSTALRWQYEPPVE